MKRFALEKNDGSLRITFVLDRTNMVDVAHYDNHNQKIVRVDRHTRGEARNLWKQFRQNGFEWAG